jgi:Ca2+-dependent lipid-binding protein
MNNKSERDNQIENKEEGILRSYLNKSFILSMLKDLLFIMLKILIMVLFYRLLVYIFPYWKFISIYIFNFIFFTILIYGISIFYVPDRSFYRFLVF